MKGILQQLFGRQNRRKLEEWGAFISLTAAGEHEIA